MIATDRNGALVDVMLSARWDLAAARAFFRSAKSATGNIPDRVTTDGHDAYPRAIRTELDKAVAHRTNVCLDNRLEQDHRGIKGRIRCMRGFGSFVSAGRFCRGHDELRNFLRVRAFHRQHVSADRRRLRQLCRAATVLAVLAAACEMSPNNVTAILTGAIPDRTASSRSVYYFINSKIGG
jgi:putative transposase